MSAKESAKVPREVLEEIGLIAETTIEFAAMEDEEIPDNVSLALTTIRGLAFGAIEGMNPTPSEDDLDLGDYPTGDRDCEADYVEDD